MNGIILAGGKSLRFGEDKAFAIIGRRRRSAPPTTMIESLILTLKPIFDKIIVVTNDPEKYQSFPVMVVTDEVKGAGPLGGIYAGLKASDSQYNFVMACDMPFPQVKLIQYLMSRTGSQVIAPDRGGKIEPLFAVYSKTCLPVIKRHLDMELYKIQDAFPYLDVEYVDKSEIKKNDPGFLSFLNLNTKKDLEKIVGCLKSSRSSVSI